MGRMIALVGVRVGAGPEALIKVSTLGVNEPQKWLPCFYTHGALPYGPISSRS